VVLKYEDHKFKTSNVTSTKPILSWDNDELIAEIKRLSDKIKVLEKQLRKGPEELRASMEVARVSCMSTHARSNFLASSNVFRVEAQIRGIDAFLEWQNEEYRVAVDKASKDLELTIIEKIGTEP
jgi:vacuolar-type H+-ATPase subunit D/Vma8